MKHLKNFAGGFFSIFLWYGPRDYVRPEKSSQLKNGFAQDAQKLSGDWVAVAGDMNNAVKMTYNTYNIPRI